MAAQTITIPFDGKPLVLKRPTVAEFDLGLVTRLWQQIYEHTETRRRIEADPQPGCSLEIDRVARLLQDCADQVIRLTKGAVDLCGVSWDGGPAELPAPSDDTAQAWIDASIAIATGLQEEARLGESSPPSA